MGDTPSCSLLERQRRSDRARRGDQGRGKNDATAANSPKKGKEIGLQEQRKTPPKPLIRPFNGGYERLPIGDFLSERDLEGGGGNI